MDRELYSLGPATIAIVRCLNPADCQKKATHLRVGNEIHHCHGGDGCECGACLDALLFGKYKRVNGEHIAILNDEDEDGQ